MHLSIMKARPEIKAIVHCHPPHATAFAVAREPIPAGIIPEVEIFLGEVPLAPYALPGTPALGASVLPFVDKANIVLLANHGTVSYDTTIERAYWWTEVLDAYCKMLILAKSIGRVNYFSQSEAQELLDLKAQWGMNDPRAEMQNCDICANDVFRESWKSVGVEQKAFLPPHYACSVNGNGKPPGPTSSNGTAPDQEALIQAITDRVMEALKK